MYLVYILWSNSKRSYYIGYTSDLVVRLIFHNTGRNRSTKFGIPWELVHSEPYKTKREAIRRERYLKSLKSHKALEELTGWKD